MRLIFGALAALVSDVSTRDIPDVREFPKCAHNCATLSLFVLDEDSQTICLSCVICSKHVTSTDTDMTFISDVSACLCTAAFRSSVLACVNARVAAVECPMEYRDTTIIVYERFCNAGPGSEPAGPSETPGLSDSNPVGEPSASPSIIIGNPSGSGSDSIAPTRTRTVPTLSATTSPGDAASRAGASFSVVLAALGLAMALSVRYTVTP